MANEFIARKGFISQGGITLPEIDISTTYTILDTDYTINCTSGTFSVFLPTAVGAKGRICVIKNSGSGTITLDANGSQTIDGATTKTLSPTDVIQVTSDGANWKVTGGIGTNVISNSAKSGSVSSGSFTGNPKTYTVTLNPAFPSANYSAVITGGDARAWTVESLTANGFTINTNSNTSLVSTTYWVAVLNT